MASSWFDMPDGKGRVGRFSDGVWFRNEEKLLRATVEVTVGLNKPESVGKKPSGFVVVEGIATKRVASFDNQDVGQSDGKGRASDEEQSLSKRSVSDQDLRVTGRQADRVH